MHGNIAYLNPDKGQGVVTVEEADGMMQRYFLLYSHIARAPKVIKVGQYVRFALVSPPPKPGLLPMAVGVEVSDAPFPDSNAGNDDAKVGA